MEGNDQNNLGVEKKNNMLVWVSGIVVVALLGYGAYKYTKRDTVVVPNTQDNGVTGTVTVPADNTKKYSYKDGSYSAIGNYFSPEGSESISVSLTLKDDVVTDANVVGQAVRRESKQYQAKFISGYKALVVGKKIEDIALTKVSGSSLTPKGFMDALNQIKTQSKA